MQKLQLCHDKQARVILLYLQLYFYLYVVVSPKEMQWLQRCHDRQSNVTRGQRLPLVAKLAPSLKRKVYALFEKRFTVCEDVEALPGNFFAI